MSTELDLTFVDQENSHMLELVIDQRSGDRLELVFVTFNEERRIDYLIDYYGGDYDLIILDGGSGDRTREIVAKRGGSVYSRLGEVIGESHFAYYVNNLTKSGRCLTLQCDEFVDLEDLKRADSVLSQAGGRVIGRRIDWFYCMEARSPTCLMPKGFRADTARFNPQNLHDTLAYAEAEEEKIIFDVDHLQIISMQDDYGKNGRYIYYEVEQLRCDPRPLRAAAKRFLILCRTTQLYIFRFPRSISFVLLTIVQFFITVLLALACYLEQKGLPDVKAQHKSYRRHFAPDRANAD